MQAARGASLNDADTQTRPAERRSRRTGVLLIVAVAIYAVDQVAKAIAVRELANGHVVAVVDDILELRLVRNPGAAFGVAGGATAFISLVALVVVIGILRNVRRLHSRAWALALGLLLGGALGNFTDRLLRPPAPLRGRVVDFLELPHWPVFNVADMAVVTGAALIVLLTLLGRQIDGTIQRG